MRSRASRELVAESQLRHAFAASGSRLAAMRGAGSHTGGPLREGIGFTGRLKAAIAGFTRLGRETSLTRCMEFDVAVVGGNALLGAVAASVAVRRGFSTLLATESRMDGVPSGLLDHPMFKLWLRKLLDLDEGIVSTPGVSIGSDPMEQVARVLRGVSSARSLLVVLPDADVEITDREAGGEPMLSLAAPVEMPVVDASARLLTSMPAGARWSAMPASTRIAAFARRVVVAGVSPGLGSPSFEPTPSGSAAQNVDPAFALFGSAKLAPLSDYDAVGDFMTDLCAVAEGDHLVGLSPRLR